MTEASTAATLECRAFPDQATCPASRQVTPHDYDTLNQDIGSGKVVYDGAKARACFDAANAAAMAAIVAEVASRPAIGPAPTSSISTRTAPASSPERCLLAGWMGSLSLSIPVNFRSLNQPLSLST